METEALFSAGLGEGDWAGGGFCLDSAGSGPEADRVQGISQGGYWVPRAVAFEKRIVAAIADPGVVDVSTLWLRDLAKPMLGLLEAGQEEFDGFMAKLMDPAAKATWRFGCARSGLVLTMTPIRRRWNIS